MAKRSKDPTFKDALRAITELFGAIIGLVGQGFFLGLGFWWAFYYFIKMHH